MVGVAYRLMTGKDEETMNFEECGVWNVECGMWSVEGSLLQGVRRDLGQQLLDLRKQVVGRYPVWLILHVVHSFTLFFEEGRRRKEVRMDIKEFAHLLTDGLIEVNEVLPIVLGKEGTQVVLVIFKERRLAIGRLQSLPMQVTPVAVGGNPGQFTMHSARFTVWLRVVTTHRQL